MNGENLIEQLQSRIIIADGALGTQFYERGVAISDCVDALSLENPELVHDVHMAYIHAGAQIIESNTFGANRVKLASHGLADKVTAINTAAAQIACEAAGDDVWVAGSIGPLGRLDDSIPPSARKDIFIEQIAALIDGGVGLIILETFNSLSEILLAMEAVKSISADIPLITNMVFTQGGQTSSGDDALFAFLTLAEHGADVVGANCGVGPSGLLTVMRQAAARVPVPVAAFPNAGFPEQVGGRTVYVSNSQYIADTAKQMAQAGAALLGGCCGTNPDDIKAMKDAIADMKPAAKKPLSLDEYKEEKKKKALERYRISEGRLKGKLGTQKVISVEIDPPKGLRYEHAIEAARELQTAGADVISIAENPLAIVRMSNVSLASMIQREIGIETVVHITGRDRNLVGMQSALLGMAIDGIKNILAITGDPPVKGREENVSGVFDLVSFDIIRLISQMNSGENRYGEDIGKHTAFTIGAAFNPNTSNMDAQVSRMKRKIEAGAQFFQTQPVFSKEAIDEVYDAVEGLDTHVLLGILPLVSSRNAEFLHNEFPGISIPAEVRTRMKAAGEDGVPMGIDIAWELIEYAYERFAGVYIMPPFNKYRIACELIKRIKQRFA